MTGAEAIERIPYYSSGVSRNATLSTVSRKPPTGWPPSASDGDSVSTQLATAWISAGLYIRHMTSKFRNMLRESKFAEPAIASSSSITTALP